MKPILLILPLSLGLLVSTNLLAQDRDDHHDDHHDDRHHVYDKHHKDYHDFDDHEERAWRIYWQQRHRRYIDWDRASESQRDAYWDWRHNHSDAVLQINIR
ncbi:MAG TPA: hypothetical protein VHZ55_01575 [Bryobacteraceae bacterium]|jgi:hypothetical protein|nr:hypothetical protein [Bryobacteraceae bacterium]